MIAKRIGELFSFLTTLLLENFKVDDTIHE